MKKIRLSLYAISIPFLYFFYLLSFAIPRNPRIWVFGSHNNSFSDNSKYLFRYASRTFKDMRVVWISGDRKQVAMIRGQGYEAHLRHSFSGWLLTARASIYIFSSYTSDINFWTSGGAITVNLWHGIPLKKIEFDVKKGKIGKKYNSYLSPIYRLFFPWSFIRPTLFVSPKGNAETVFGEAFRLARGSILPLGTPRTDVLFPDTKKNGFHEEDEKVEDLNLLEMKKTYAKILLYMPTFRDNNESLESCLDLAALNGLLHKLNFCLAIKLHPNVKTPAMERFSNIRIVPSKSDVYPILTLTDALITDYSSIFFDYLLLEKPILFYAYDKDRYLNDERGLYFDYDSFVPGPVLESFNALLHAIEYDHETVHPRIGSLRREIWSNYSGTAAHDIAHYLRRKLNIEEQRKTGNLEH